MRNQYRIQAKDGKKFYTLALEDITIRTDSELKSLVENFAANGNSYRGQIRTACGWITLIEKN